MRNNKKKFKTNVKKNKGHQYSKVLWLSLYFITICLCPVKEYSQISNTEKKFNKNVTYRNINYQVITIIIINIAENNIFLMNILRLEKGMRPVVLNK